MFIWIIQISIISIAFIFLVHHLWMFFKSTLTIPKFKDLVNSPNEKYQQIFDTISHKSFSGYTDIDLLPKDLLPNTDSSNNNSYNNELSQNNDSSNIMKDELKNFLKQKLNGNNNIPSFSNNF